MVFQIPESDVIPESRNIASVFPPARDRITVFLAVPGRKFDGLNCALTEPTAADSYRYIAQTELLTDETTGRDEKEVRIGRKNLRIVLDTELADDMVSLPIARVMRSGSGKFIFDPNFVPPCAPNQRQPPFVEPDSAHRTDGRKDVGPLSFGGDRWRCSGILHAGDRQILALAYHQCESGAAPAFLLFQARASGRTVPGGSLV